MSIPAAGRRMTEVQRRIILWVLYGGLGLLLVLIVSGALVAFFPSALSTRVAYNSEGYLFAVVLAAWIQFALPRIPERRRLPWSLVFSVFWAIIGLALIASDLPSRIRTLNEGALGLAFMIIYVALRRPLPRWVPYLVVIPVLMTVWAIASAPTSWIIDQAESFGFVVLAVLTFDVFDRRLLERGAPVSTGLRWGWYAFMILEPIVVSAMGMGAREGGSPLADTLQYLGRIHESFVGVLLVALILHVARGVRHSALKSVISPATQDALRRPTR